jgi:hypothetical protein
MEIRGISISFASYKKKKNNNREKILQTKINDLENNLSNENTEEYSLLQLELKQLHEEKAKGAFIRSKAKWSTEGEHLTKYFCNLEKHNYTSKTIKTVTREDGTVTTNQNEILNEVKLVYEHLYKA